jgi:TPR repeat protein
MPKTFTAHCHVSGNSDAGSPLSRGRAGRISVGAFAAALLPLLLRPAGATEPDLAFGAFQTGHYLTAFGIAINRIELKKDPKAMTLLGELYPGGLGVPQNDVKAADWYKLAADRGDREAMFALAMFWLQGRTARPRCRCQMACRCGQARPFARGLRSRASLHGRPIVSAGFHARRRAPAHRRASRPSGGAIRARHALQAGPRRRERHEGSDAAMGTGGACRQR